MAGPPPSGVSTCKRMSTLLRAPLTSIRPLPAVPRRPRPGAWPSAKSRGPAARPPLSPPPRPARLARLAAFLRQPPLWLTLLVCGVILVARRPELFRHPQFWAEDGALFFVQAWEQGARALFLPYAGYLHTTQRLVTALAVQCDPRWAPAIFVGATFVLTLYVAARTQSSRLPFRPHVAFALAVVLVPDAFEVLLFLVNAQWVLAGGLVLLLVSADARRPLQHVHDALAAVLLSLTGPFSVLLSPLFLWRALHRCSRASTLLAALVLSCAAVQTWFILHAPSSPPASAVATEHVLSVPGLRVLGSLFAASFVAPGCPLLVATALGALAVLLVTALALQPGPARPERIWLALAFGLFLAASLFRCRTFLPGICDFSYGSRYFFAPQLLFIWLVASVTGATRRWLARLATFALLGMLATNLPRLREHALEDLDWPAHAAKLRAGEAVTVPVNPAGWSFPVSARKP